MMSGVSFSKATLLIAGPIACLVGFASLVVPIETEGGLGITVGSDVELLNELRASGGGLAATGIFIFIGIFVAELTYAATIVSTLLYLGYGFSRLLSVMLDGIPDTLLLLVMAVEFVIGLLCLAAFLICRCQRAQSR